LRTEENSSVDAGTLASAIPLETTPMPGLAAIGSSAVGAAQSGTSKTALRADLARYERVRTDCVNCSSAKTIEGKRNIQNLDTQISAIKAKLTVVPQAGAAASVAGSQARSSAATATATATATASASASAGRVDVYA
jgi:hypothetical protein